MLDRAISQCAVAIWATNLDGEVVLSEGGLLSQVGLEPGQVVGLNVRDFPNFEQWQQAVVRIHKGEEKVTFVSEVNGAESASTAASTHPSPYNSRGIWLETYAPLRSPAGRVVGILASAMSISDALPIAPLSDCPFGGCLIERDEQQP